VHASGRGQRGFTLIELLIVIGLLAALATLVLSNLTVTRTEALDDSLVQKELADIQRAFQRFAADCAPKQNDYKKIAKYGLAPLMQFDEYLAGGDTWTFSKWDNDRRRGWRGPYLDYEDNCTININTDAFGIPVQPGQPPYGSGSKAPVISTPYKADKDGIDGDYYRVIPETDAAHDVKQLWVVFPSHSGVLTLQSPTAEDPSGVRDLPYKRRLMLD